MTRIDCISISDPLEWNKALEGIKHSYAHTWEYNYAMQLTTGLPTYLFKYKKYDIKIVCPIAERKYLSYTDILTPFGISGFVGNGPCDEFPLIWRRFAEEKGYICGYIVIHPALIDCSYFREDDVYKYNDLFIFNLSLSEDQLFSNLSKGRRRQLRNWSNDLEKIVTEKQVLIDFFLKHYHEFCMRRKAPANYLFTLDTLSFLLKQHNVFMIGIMQDGQIVSVEVFAHTQVMGDSLFNISIPGGEQYSVVLIWYGLKKLKSMRIPYLNIGGGSSEVDDSLAAFKRRFNTEVHPLRALKQIYYPRIYEQLCLLVDACPLDKSGYFPPYHMPA